MKNVYSLMSFVLTAFVAGSAFASDAEFNYRDRVENEALMGTNVTMRFAFYATANGVARPSFWTDQSVKVASDGRFCAVVSVPTNASQAVFSTTNDRYIAVSVPNAADGTPSVLLHGCRRKLMPVPTAIYARDASEAPDGFLVRGKTTLVGGFVLAGDSRTYKVDENGRMVVTNFFAGSLTADNGDFGGSLSVGKDLLMTKSMKLNDEKKTDGATLTGSNTTLVVKSLATQSLTMPGKSGSLVPSGLIMMWYGSTTSVPPGWVLCDGKNGTPDLTGRFIVGASSRADQWYTYNTTGGAREVTLTVEQMPKHGHDFFGDDQLVAHAVKSRDQSGYDAKSEKKGDSAFFRTGEAGLGKAHENRPPFKAVCYIMKK